MVTKSQTPLKPARRLSKDGSIHVTDEILNTVISSLGALLSLVGTLLLVILSVKAQKPWHTLSFAIYGLSLINLFTASAVHHGVDGTEKTEHLLRQWDYYAIYLTIAGTFTPFCVILLHNRLGWFVLGLIWILAIFGLSMKALFPHIPKWVSTALYIGMGWLGLAIAVPLYRAIPTGLGLLILGGIFYTVGAMIFFFEKPNPFPGKFGFHEIWHLFVLAGSASHFSVMYFFILPLP